MVLWFLWFACANARTIEFDEIGTLGHAFIVIKYIFTNVQLVNLKAEKLCQDYYRDYHNVHDINLISNDEINHGHQGNVSINYKLHLCIS